PAFTSVPSTSRYIPLPLTSSTEVNSKVCPSQRIRIAVVISTSGITRNRKRSVAVEKDAMFAHFSLPCRPSRYARTPATVTSVSVLKPSSSCVNCFSTMVMKVFIFPKLMSHLPFPVEPKQKVDRVPDLLCRVCVISKESARGTVPGLIEMRCQHDYRLFGSGRHRILGVIALLNVLVALRVGNSGGDV